MARLTVAMLAWLLTVPGNAGEPVQHVDFSLFESAESIGDGTVDPRPPPGSTLLLQFWASWCHSCGSLMWDMDELTSDNAGVTYVAVSIDDEADDARTYIRKHRLFEKYSDRYFVDSEKALSGSLDVMTVPTILLIDADGKVLVRKSGHLNGADLRELVVAMNSD